MIRFDREILPFWHYVMGILGIIFVFTALSYSFWVQNTQAINARDETLKIQDVINEIHVISSKLKSAVLAHHRYILLGDKRNKEEYKSFKSNKLNEESTSRHIILQHSVEDDLNEILTLTKDDPEQNARVKEIVARFSSIWSALDNVLEIYESGHYQEAIDKLNLYMIDQVAPMRVLIRDALSHESNLLKIKTALRDKEANDRTFLIFSGISFFCLLEIVLYTLLLRLTAKTRKAEKDALLRASEAEAANQKLDLANKELFELNKMIQESKETQIKAIIDHALDGQIMMDAEGVVIRYNRAAERMFLYAPSEIIGRNITNMLVEPYASECIEHFRQHRNAGLCNGTDHRHEIIGRRKNGTIFPADLSMSMFNLGGHLHFSWFLRDITERKRSEAEILRYTKELEKSNRDLDDFAYIASHDLKEPLRGLVNHAQFLLEDYTEQLDDDGKRRLSRLTFLSQRMEHLVNDLLYYSRLGRSDLAIQETDINQIVIDIRQMIEPLLKEKNAKIEIDVPLPMITCDKPRMTEALRNLIINGIKYNDKPDKRIAVGFLSLASAPHGEERDVFYVKDNGVGIDQQYFQEIFRIFRRLQKNEANDQSTGSGLTFVKKIVERHKGHIWLESELGKGTTFFFNLGAMEAQSDGSEQNATNTSH